MADTRDDNQPNAPDATERPRRRRILIVSPDRKDRRRLFDALDQRGFSNALTAPDTGQAREFLGADRNIGLVFLDLRPATGDIAAFCADLGSGTGIPVIGILRSGDSGERWNWENLPPGVREVVRSPVEPGEVMHRLKRAFKHRGSMEPVGGTAGVDVFDQVPNGLLLVDINTLAITQANTAAQDLTGLSAEELQGSTLMSIDHSHDDEQKGVLEAALKRDGGLKFETYFRGRRRHARNVEVTVQLGVFDGKTQYLAVLHDLWQEQQVEQALSIIGASFEAILDDDRVERLVEQTAKWLGLDYLLVAVQADKYTQLAVKALYSRRHPPEGLSEIMCDGIARSVLSGDSALFEKGAWQEVTTTDRFIQDHNIEAYIGLPIVDSTKEVIGILVAACRQRLDLWNMAREALPILAGRLALEEEMRRFQSDTRSQGLHDALTRLPNRMLFDDRIALALKEAKRTGEMFAVMMVDLDRFQNINDSLGHETGDRVLKGVARRMSATIRASDTVARYAGDQFMLVLRHVIQKEDALRIARKLNQVLVEPLTLDDGKQIQVTASIGLSFYPDDGTSIEDLIKHATQATNQAKGMGRHTYQSFVSVPEESHQQKLLLESKLRSAERNNEFRVYYQPQISAETEDIVGMEALIRWEHPDLGLISPGFFIPLAEETGLIVPIGEWLMRTACAQAKEWQARYNLSLKLGVNLSALQLKQRDFVKTVEKVLADTGYDARLLDMEVTESISIKDVQNLLEVLEGIRGLGCLISIDDFGTGQSSLDYIKRFPANRIKIDQTFVRNIGVDPDDAAIVEATISMAHNLNRAVVAEGVEEEGQLEFLMRNGCEELQGYLFSRPLPAKAFERMLAERERMLKSTADQPSR